MVGKIFLGKLRRSVAGLALLILASSWSVAVESTATSTTNTVAQLLEIPGIHNAFRASPKIYSGSQPEGDAAFAALAKLGVKTIVSVDGSKPDVEAARKHGLRYIHLPYGYDGIPTNRVAELSKLAHEDLGPFFVHCHHGLHRGPAAVAVMCEASEGWSPDQAVAWLGEAGTSKDYPGLYRAAAGYQKPTAAELAAVKTFPEITQPSTVVDAMVKLDEHFSNLKLAQKSGWKTPPGHADLSPAHEATMLWEQFQELARLPDTGSRPEAYRAKLAASEQAAAALRKLFKEAANFTALDAALKQISQNCAACHKTYRNE